MEKRFPTKLEIEDLRKEGKLAISAYSSRVIASVCAIFFLLNSELPLEFRNFLEIEELQTDNLIKPFVSLSVLLLKSLAVFIGVYLLASLLQSRFFFSSARIFKRKSAFFSLGRAVSFFKLEAIVTACAVCIILAVFLLISWKFLLIDSISTQNIDIKAISEELGENALNLFYSYLLLLLVFAVLVFVYKKVGFLMSNRVSKRG